MLISRLLSINLRMSNSLVKLDWCGDVFFNFFIWLRVKYILRKNLGRGPNEATTARVELGVPSSICL